MTLKTKDKDMTAIANNEVKTSVRIKLASESILSVNTTGPGSYYKSAGEALGLIFDICQQYGLEMSETYLANANNEGRRMIAVTREDQEVGVLVYCWYKTQRGSYEITVYLSKV